MNLPPSKPRASLGVVIAAGNKAWQAARPGTPLPDFFVLVVRAYYRDTMGVPRSNDYGIYDDAVFIVSPFGFSPWNGNSDPSRIGWNPGAGKYMARLKPGIYKFRSLKHKINSPLGYMAFGQGASPVTVERIRQDGTIAQTETGRFGINLHRGGQSGTSSEGCLTVPPGQWIAFRNTLDTAIARMSAETFPLILVEGPLV
jgi:lysozyme